MLELRGVLRCEAPNANMHSLQGALTLRLSPSTNIAAPDPAPEPLPPSFPASDSAASPPETPWAEGGSTQEQTYGVTMNEMLLRGR